MALDLPTRLDLYALGRDYVIQRAAKIDAAQVDTEGSDVNLVVGVTSVMADHIVKQLGYRFAALLLDGAENEDLDRLVFDRYQLVRKGASPALGKVTISRPAATFANGSVPIGTKLQTLSNAEYITTSLASFGATDLVVPNVNVRASVAGKASQVGTGQLRRFQRPDLLWDPTLTVTNPAPTAHGEDQESDDDLRNRARTFWKTARRGILAAIEAGALSVPGIVSAQAVEALTPGGQPARIVQLYVADSTGIASDVIVNQVNASLLDFRAGGIAVVLTTSLPTIVQAQLTLRFRSNVDTVSLTQQVIAAVVEFINSIPVNGTLFLSDIYSVLRRFVADGLIVKDDAVVAPAGDIVPTPGQTLRTTLSNVTANVVA